MKFARYLEENVVVEWRRAYIQYRGLKKLIKRVDARYRARTALELKRKVSQASASSRGFSNAVGSLRNRRKAVDDDNSDTAASESALIDNATQREAQLAAASAPESENDLPVVSLDGTGLSLSWREDQESDQSNSNDSPRVSAVNTHGSTADTIDSANAGVDVEAQATASSPRTKFENTSNAKTPREEQDESQGNGEGKLPSKLFSRFSYNDASRSRKSSYTGSLKKKNKRQERLASLRDFDATLAAEFDQEERKFFSALDNELERIVAFYLLHERDMTKRYEMLARQLRELSEHRKEYKAKHPLDDHRKFGDRLVHLVHIPQPAASAQRLSAQLRREVGKVGKGGSKQTMDKETKHENADDDEEHDEGDRRRAQALAKMLNIAGGTLSDVEDEQMRRANEAAAMSLNPERYQSARKQLKAALLEYYRGIEILKNYQVLNRTGFAKILKKFEKTTGVHVGDAYYRLKISSSMIGNTDVMDKLLKSTEETYTAYFEHGNRKRALERLRINANSGTNNESFVSHYASMLRTGIYLGITLCAFVGGFVNAHDPARRATIPLWEKLMRMYGAEFIPTVFALLFGVNLLVWHHMRINTVFIFEFDVRHSLDYHQYFEIPAFFLLLLSIFFWVSFLNPFPDAIAPTTWPLVWLVVVLVVMLNPLPILHYHSRRWFITSIGRVLHGGVLGGVEFRDFFLGDELVSLAWPMSMLWFLGCEYHHQWAAPNHCDPNGTFWTAALLGLPALLRLSQCLRRYYDSAYTANLHLVNAGKYMMTVFHYWFYINYRYHGSKRPQDLALWCVFGCIYAIYAALWDILMDWSLLQRRGKFFGLRAHLVYEDYWPIYYWAMVTDFILRFGWAIYLLPGPASSLTRVFLVALLEMLRRWQWNFFRLENEHLGNVDMYRVSRDVPLPYSMPKRADSDDEDFEGKGRPWHNPIILRVLSRFSSKPHKSSSSSFALGSGHHQGAKSGQKDSSEAARTASDNSLGKQRAHVGDDNNDRQSHPPETQERVDDKKYAEGGESILQKVRNVLVPDHGGLNARGSRLDDMGAAKGSKARDYQPRKVEVGGDADSTPSASEDSDGEDEETASSGRGERSSS